MKWYTKDLERELQQRVKIPASWFNIGFRRYHFTRILNLYFRWFKKRMMRGDIIGFRYFYLAMEEKDKPLKKDLSSEHMKWSNARAVINTKRRTGEFPPWDPDDPYNYEEFKTSYSNELFQELFYEKFMKKINRE